MVKNLAIVVLTAFLGFSIVNCKDDPFFIPVRSITGVPDTGMAGVPLTLTGTVNPGIASNSSITWSVRDAGGTRAFISGKTLNAEMEGVVLIRAKVANGKGQGNDYTQDFSITISRGSVCWVTFDSTGGSEIDRQPVSEGETARRPVNPVMDDWGFVDWYIDQLLTIPYNFDTPVTEDITLYAMWSDIIFTVTFESNGGSPVAPQTVGKDGKIGRPNPDPAKPGYAFDGWYKDNTSFLSLWDFGTDMVTGDITLYAKWKAPPAARIGTVGYLTLYEAINAAANGSASSPTVITILRDITVPEEEMDDDTGYIINKNIRLTVESGRSRTIAALAGNFTLFTVNANSSLTLQGSGAGTLTLNGNNETGASGRRGVYVAGNSATFTMNSNVIITGFNNGDGSAGSGSGTGTGVYVDNNGTFTMNGGIITGNRANNGSGGGVYVRNGTFTMKSGTIADNKADGNNGGGGVFVDNGIFTMSGGKISTNEAIYGGGVIVFGGTFTMSGGEISGNTANGSGGGVYVTGANTTFTMSGSKISGNTANNNGGGVLVNAGTFIMNSGEISGNTANKSGGSGGGGVYTEKGIFTMNGGEISGNTAGNGNGNGGGVFVTDTTFTMSGGKISGNMAGDGGGVYTEKGIFTMNDGEISGNTANNNGVGAGGGVIVDGGTFTMSGGEISVNTVNKGGGVYLYVGNFTMSGGTIYGVDAPAGYPNKVSGSGADGAAVYVNSGTAKYDGAYAGKGYGSGDDGNAIVTTNNTVPFIKSATVPVTGVTLNKTTASLTVGGTETLTATVTPTNATNKTVTWSTSTPAVATVSNGVVTAVAAGTATITVTTVDGGKTATCAVTVTQPSTPPEEITSGKGIVLVKIPAGIFTMGSPTTEPDRSTDETQHPVTLTKSFYMGKYPVTQEQYQAVMGTNPSYFTTMVSGESGTPGKLPVEGVSWYDALVFCNTLSIMEGLSPVYSISDKTNPADWGTVPTSSPAVWDAVVMVSGANGYRLPTEAEWEYVCRAGTTTAYNTGATISDNTGWYDYNSSSKTHQVGLKPANAWGLYDMHGNVFEWCWDWLGSYSNGAQTDPQGAVTGTNRVGRGGSWGNYGRDLRSALRGDDTPSGRGDYLGFRLVRSVP